MDGIDAENIQQYCRYQISNSQSKKMYKLNILLTQPPYL